MGHSRAIWTETDSRAFLDLAEIAVPGRDEQMDVIVSLIPASDGEAFLAAEIGCGEGLLAQRILERFLKARFVAFDGSNLMRQQASARLSDLGARAEVRPFDLQSQAWLDELP